MDIQTRPQLALQKWEPAGQVILEIFLTIKLKAYACNDRTSWILNECTLYCKIVKYCILSEVCMTLWLLNVIEDDCGCTYQAYEAILGCLQIIFL